jgi:TfoX/Sxy family transcriptional regulator of competence genes
MAYNENLADRTRELIALPRLKVEEKKMFGGLCFMVDDKMCLGIIKDELMVRLDPALNEEVLEMEGCRPMDFSGKSMTGFVFVTPEAVDTEAKLKYWTDLALEYNPKAQANRKKKSPATK